MCQVELQTPLTGWQ